MMTTVGLKRKGTDKFYTKPGAARLCVDYFRTLVDVSQAGSTLIVEPSAGAGVFLPLLGEICDNIVALDLLPEGDNIKEQDYLTYEPDLSSYDRVYVIGNPPFGRQSCLALKFIKHTCQYADAFGFILPRSFKKDSMKDKIPLDYVLVGECDLSNDSFTVDGADYDVPCVFQVWRRSDVKRTKVARTPPDGYEFVTKDEPHSFAVRRVGVNAGRVITETAGCSVQSHYFVRCDGITNEQIEKLREVVFETRDMTVGARSIGKQEFILKYNTVLGTAK